MQATHQVKVDLSPTELGEAIANGDSMETIDFWCSYASNINQEAITEAAKVMVKHGYHHCKAIKSMANAINYHEMMKEK